MCVQQGNAVVLRASHLALRINTSSLGESLFRKVLHLQTSSSRKKIGSLPFTAVTVTAEEDIKRQCYAALSGSGQYAAQSGRAA